MVATRPSAKPTGRAVADEREGFFGPGSMVWTVDREAVVLAAGGLRALLMQVAHPLVAAGVAEHSRYRSDPFGRLRHTLQVSYSFAFAERSTARAMILDVNRRHAAVRGTLHEPVGAFPESAPYRALDPDLLLWVYATLIESSLLSYDRFVRPLSPAERDGYWTEGKREGSIWGIPNSLFPDSFADLQAWMRAQEANGTVRVGPQGREIAGQLLRPPFAWVPRLVMLPTALVTLWLLPPVLREQFGFSWGPRRERLMRAVAAASRASVPWLPPPLRYMPHYRAALKRLQMEQV